ncbi:MAG: DMT family transporter [Methylobacteriaceae bacterium]|jgi:drug/metabolite transporter (DMT)-like permease|nr:DMT family transporter [Methylobacteriaceae bacterium]
MNAVALRSSLLLLLAAAIWGSAFVAQKDAAQHIGPLWFIAIRYCIASLVLLPFALHEKPEKKETLNMWGGGVLIALFLMAGSVLQQTGIPMTSVANAGFITGLYVAFIPVLGLLFGQIPKAAVWFGTALAVIGMYFLSVPDSSALTLATLNRGDLVILAATIFWAAHIMALSSSWGRRLTPIRLSETQFGCCAVMGLTLALLFEPFDLAATLKALPSLLFVAVFSSCIAFSLQITGQRHVPAAPAAIILSLEAVFAALAGWVMLGEALTPRGFLGAAMMLAGVLATQLAPLRQKQAQAPT